MSEPIKILVELEGGLVTAVWSSLATPGAIEVRIVDHDEREVEFPGEAQEIAEEVAEDGRWFEACVANVY